MRPLTRFTPKPLIPLGGVPLLGRTLGLLEQAGIRTITLVTGYRERQVITYVRNEFRHLRIRFVRNPIYAKSNTLYSLWMARHAVKGKPFLLIDGDLVFEPRVLETALAKGINLVLCDRSTEVDPEAVKVYGKGFRSRVLHIGKAAQAGLAPLGESIGFARIGARNSHRLFAACGMILRAQGQMCYYEAAFQTLIEEGVNFWVEDIQGAKWVEIDTNSDLMRARSLFSPKSIKSNQHGERE